MSESTLPRRPAESPPLKDNRTDNVARILAKHKRIITGADGQDHEVSTVREGGKTVAPPAVKEVLCCQQQDGGKPFFAVATTGDGKVVAVWENHSSIHVDLAALKNSSVLNQHELQLLEYKAHV